MTGKTREDHLAVPEPAAPGRNIVQPLGVDPGREDRCFDHDLIVMGHLRRERRLLQLLDRLDRIGTVVAEAADRQQRFGGEG